MTAKVAALPLLGGSAPPAKALGLTLGAADGTARVRRSPRAKEAQPEMAEIKSLLQHLVSRVDTIEGSLPGGRAGGAPGLHPPAAVPSLLATGRVPPPPGHVAASAIAASPSAYQTALEGARALLPGQVPHGPPPPAAGGVPHCVPPAGHMHALGAEPDVRGRQRASDHLVQAVLQGGDQGQIGAALNLAMVEAIERLRGPHAHGEDDEFDSLLSGAQGSLDDHGSGGGSKGIQAMLRLSRAIEKNPSKWCQTVDEAAWRALGCDVTGQPWSMMTYGAQRIRFGRLADHQRMWTMLSSLHSLHRAGNHAMVGARIGQCLKSVEASVALGGNWDMAWLYTGLPDPIGTGGLHRGLSTPGEVAAAAGFLRDMQAVEASLKRSTSAGGGVPLSDAPAEKKKTPKAPKGKGKEAATPSA
eukprot:3585052-Amphidinium_carterae.1